MTGRHAGEPGTFDATVSDYVTGRARELIRQHDQGEVPPFDLNAVNRWMGSAAEILRELTRDA